MSTYSSYHDDYLLQLLKGGDEAAFTEIYKRYWKRLFGLAVYKLKNAEEAEEILQDIFLDMWRRREVLNIQTRFSSYLSAALSYRVFNYYAKLHHHKSLEASDALSEADHSTQNHLRAMELNEDIEALVGQLPEKCQLIFRLSREQEYTNRQIAEQVQISEKTVESHITRALRFLRAGIGFCLAFLF